MSAKPVTVPTWATNANFSTGDFAGLPTKVAPSAGVRADGHIPETAPGPQHENYDRNLIGEWLTYLSDGALSGPHSITNTLSVVGLSVAHSDLLTASAYIQAGNGASSVAALLVDGGIDVVPGSISNAKGLRVRAQGPIALRDTEAYRYCDSTGALTSPTRSGVQVPLRADGGWTWSGGYLVSDGTGNCLYVVDLKLPNGATLSEVRAGVNRAAGGAGNVELEVYSIAHDTGAAPGVSVATSLGSDATVGTGGGADRLAVSSMTFTQGVANIARVYIRDSASGGADALYWITMTYSDPGPRNF